MEPCRKYKDTDRMKQIETALKVASDFYEIC